MHACTETIWNARVQVERGGYPAPRGACGNPGRAAIRASQRKEYEYTLDVLYEISGGITTTISFLWLKALNDIKKDEYVTLIYVKNVMKEERHV